MFDRLPPSFASTSSSSFVVRIATPDSSPERVNSLDGIGRAVPMFLIGPRLSGSGLLSETPSKPLIEVPTLKERPSSIRPLRAWVEWHRRKQWFEGRRILQTLLIVVDKDI
jgi:hypothetical protein